MNDLLLAPHTTLRLGGPAGRLTEIADDAELVEAIRDLDDRRWPLLLLGGGSNVVISDEGFRGAVILVRTNAIVRTRNSLTVAAGTPWDDLVAFAVREELSGLECLSGIPGSTGATPIQNVGAYGQDVSQTITGVRAYDRHGRSLVDIPSVDCGFAYRDSRFKREAGRYALVTVTFELEPSTLSRPIAYRELAEKLGVATGERAPLAEVRAAVLELRAGKGMVIDETDPDTRSVGSFFTNPIVDRSVVAGWDEPFPSWPEPDGRVKLSAAWLVQHAGFEKGYGDDRARISTKHTLALTSGETGTTEDLLALARTIRAGVGHSFGIQLVPEPVLIGAQF